MNHVVFENCLPRKGLGFFSVQQQIVVSFIQKQKQIVGFYVFFFFGLKMALVGLFF